MHYVTGALVVVLLVAIAIFAIQNLEAVEVSFLFWSVNMSKVFVILGTYVLGMATGGGLVAAMKWFFQDGG
jgi:uncharacterized integral membrane protein